MKILNVNVLLDPVYGGGTAERTFQMSKALLAAGAECTILTTDVGLSAERIKSLAGIPVIALPCLSKRFFIVKFPWRRLKELISSVDVIHMMGHWSMLNVLVYLLARRTSTPYVICPAGELVLFGRSRWIKLLFNAVIGRRLVRNAAGYIAITPDEIPVFGHYGVEARRISVIPNGINADDFQPPDGPVVLGQFNTGEHPYVLFMGRLNPIKGPDLLLQAFISICNQFPIYHLVFAGPDGGMLATLKNLCLENEISHRVHFVGYLGGNNKSSAYRDAALLAIPSRQEAMSIVVIEAGILGTPVLLTDCCGFDEVEASGGGIVVPATVMGLRNGMISMLENPQKLVQMGARLQELVNKNYLWNQMASKYLDVYKKILICPPR